MRNAECGANLGPKIRANVKSQYHELPTMPIHAIVQLLRQQRGSIGVRNKDTVAAAIDSYKGRV